MAALLAGCEDESMRIPPVYAPSIVNPDAKDLKVKFGIETPGSDGVRETFNTVSAYLNYSNPEVTGENAEIKIGGIELGDYINLEAGLSVKGYPVDDDTEGYGKLTGAVNAAITGGANRGTLLRLIVVGINSFNGINGNGNFHHLVFQFQNVPVKHRMNPTATNIGGYLESEVREYLVPVEGKDGSGAFLEGLIDAGLPENVLYAPKRMVWHGWTPEGQPSTQTDEISDKLWLPTAREARSTGGNYNYETDTNQVHLMSDSAIKYAANNSAVEWWSASPMFIIFDTHHPATPTQFHIVSNTGSVSSNIANLSYGIAPAFCVR